MKNETKGPKDFFLWLGVMATLYISSINLVVLLFEYIRILFPDDLDYYVDPYRGTIRFSIASLIVLFPLYLYLTRLINKDSRKNPEKRELKSRKWALYLTLFVAGATIVIDLIVLINGFLGGELTTRFVLQLLTVLVVIGGVFFYYFYELKGYWHKNEKKSILVGQIVALIVLASIVAGFFIMGSPATQRLLRFDQERVNDLQSIQWQILNQWQSSGSIPETLEELNDDFSGFAIPTDPETEEPYGYTKAGATSFELCADFNLESIETRNEASFRPKYGFEQANWEHEAGLVCFDREIDPELYPVREN